MGLLNDHEILKLFRNGTKEVLLAKDNRGEFYLFKAA
jgi:hypothetical protein